MNSHPSSGSHPSQTDIVLLAQQYVLNLFNQKNDSRLVFHTFRQTTEIARTVHVIAEAVGATSNDWEIAELAAWFCNVGYLFDYQQPAKKALELADKFLSAYQFPNTRKKELLSTLREVISAKEASRGAAQLLSDAICAVQFGPSFFEEAERLLTERKLILGLDYTPDTWDQYLMQLLLKVRFQTAHAKIHYEPITAEHIVFLNGKMRPTPPANDGVAVSTAERELTSSEPTPNGVRSGEFWMIAYQNHLRASAQADRKAHTLLIANFLLITLGIALMLVGGIVDVSVGLSVPAILMIVAGLVALAFAVMAALPRVTSVVHEGSAVEEARNKLLFFGNFLTLSESRFTELLKEVLDDETLLHQNLCSDLFNLGKVLDYKFRYVSWSYTAFMLGVAFALLAFFAVCLA